MVDAVVIAEDNITPWPVRTSGVAPPGSESMACLEGIFVNMGGPHSSPRREYRPTSLNSEGGEMVMRESAGLYYL